MIKVKICCIKDFQEAKLAIKYGASALGLVSKMPSGPGVISEETIKDLAQKIPPAVSSFLLTSLQDVDSIVLQQKRVGTNTIQICDRLLTGSYLNLRKELPGISIIQVIHVSGEESIEEAKEIAGYVNGILLDSGNQLKEIKELGGTGRIHNWQVSRKIVESVEVPVFLAGGLNASNIMEAIKIVKPFGVDVCNGVRTNGFLDENKLSSFFKEINSINFN